MNKLKVTIATLFVACLGIGVVSAQTAPTTPAPAKSTASTPAKPTQHLKKDGTPDMRYKENKAAAKSTTTPAAKKATETKKAAPKKAAAGGNM
jgi:hypothetical protein